MATLDRIDLRSIIPFRIPVGDSAPLQLLDARSRVSGMAEAGDGVSVWAAIDVEAWYRAGDGSVGCHRETLSAVLRGEELPASAQPSIVSEQYLLSSGEHRGGPPLLQGELRVAWRPDPPRGLSPSIPVSLELVHEKKTLEIPVQIRARFSRRLRSVVDVRINHDSTARLDGGCVVAGGMVRADLVVEYEDGTLARRTESVPFERPELMAGRPGQRVHAFAKPAFSSSSLSENGLFVTVDVLMSVTLVDTEIGTAEIWQPDRLEGGGVSPRVILTVHRRQIARIACRTGQSISIPGVPAGAVHVTLAAPPVQRLSAAVVQEITAVCDVYFTDGNEERRFTTTLEDAFLNAVAVPLEHISSEVELGGPAMLAPTEDGLWMLAVPIEWCLYEEEIRPVKVVESDHEAGCVESVVEELVSRSPVRFLVPLPDRAMTDDMDTRLEFLCLAGAGHCRLEGRLAIDAYTATPGGPQKMVPVIIPFSETVGVPQSLPEMTARCDLEATVVPVGHPVVMIEGSLTLSRRRTAWLVRGSPTAVKPSTGIDCHLFWRSVRPVSGCNAPVRIEARAEELVWRLAEDHLVIQGRLGRVLYFADPGGRLYCTTERIPFTVLTRVPAPSHEMCVSVAHIDSLISPARRRGLAGVEEEYHLRLEVTSGRPGQTSSTRFGDVAQWIDRR